MRRVPKKTNTLWGKQGGKGRVEWRGEKERRGRWGARGGKRGEEGVFNCPGD